jgi:hypothetical protein
VIGSRNVRMVRRSVFMSVLAVSGLIATASPAAACPPLDPGCVLEDTTTTAAGVLEDTTTTAAGVLSGDDGLPVGEVPGAGGVVPASGNGSQPGGGGTIPPGGGDTSGGGGTTSGGGTQAGPPPGPQGDRALAQSGPGSVITTPARVASTIAGRPLPIFLDEGSGALLTGSRLVKTLGFPFILILLVVAFLFVQNRIDRRDPKLALAPVGSEYVPFT